MATSNTVEILAEGQADLVQDWFDEDTRRKTALDLFIQGVLKAEEIAEQIGVGRATYFRWKKHPAWMAKLKATLEEMMIGRKLRRFHQTTRFTDYLGAKVEMLMHEEARSIQMAKSNPSVQPVDNSAKISKALQDFRAMRAEERLDSGEAEQRVHLHVEQETDHAQHLKNPFTDVLQRLFGEGLMKDSRIQDSLGISHETDYADIDPAAALVALTEVSLQDSNLLADFDAGQPVLEVKRRLPRIRRSRKDDTED